MLPPQPKRSCRLCSDSTTASQFSLYDIIVRLRLSLGSSICNIDHVISRHLHGVCDNHSLNSILGPTLLWLKQITMQLLPHVRLPDPRTPQVSRSLLALGGPQHIRLAFASLTPAVEASEPFLIPKSHGARGIDSTCRSLPPSRRSSTSKR